MTALEFSEPSRPSRAARGRTPSGGGGAAIGLVIPMAVTLVAAVVLIAGGLIVSGGSSPETGETLDKVGMNAVLALSVVEPETWTKEHGVSTKGFYELFVQFKDKRVRELQRQANAGQISSQEPEALKQRFAEIMEEFAIEKPAGSLAAESDKRIREANAARMQRLVDASDGQVIYAAILGRNGGIVVDSGAPAVFRPGQKYKIGDVTVTRILVSEGGADVEGRKFEIDIKDRLDAPAGRAEIYISGRSAVVAGGGSVVTALVVALVGTLLVGLIAFLMCQGPSKAVRQLTQDLDQLARGDLDVRITPRGGGEAGAAARAADRALKTFRAIQDQAAAAPVAAAPEPVDASVLLPSEPPRYDGYEIEAVHKPAAEGANDFFDYISVDDEHFGIVIADMPHAGAQGAFIAATFRALMRAHAVGEASPATVLARVNRVMADELKRGDHITAMYTVLDVPNGILSVASAGHLPLIFWKLSKKGSALLNPEGIAIGLDRGPVFEKTVVDKRIKLEKGDRYVLHTDGPVAAKNINGEEYGEERFYYLVNREAPKNSAAFVNFVANEVDLFHEGAAQIDDITIVTVRKLTD